MRAAPIFQITVPNGAHSLARYRGRDARALQSRLQVLLMDHVLDKREWQRGVYLFTSLDGMNEAQRRAAQSLYDAMRQSPSAFVPLNDPKKILGRFELLRALHERGHNDFNVHRATDGLGSVRFPAFVRYENLHRANLSGLVRSRDELEDAIAGLLAKGERAQDLLVTEHLDYHDADGVYRKYGVHIVGKELVAKHLMAGPRWMIKMKTSDRRSVGDDELAFVRDFPHRALLEPVFALSGHEWGRADYSFCKGRMQVWEINDNPEFGTKWKRDLGRRRIHRIAFPRFEAALDRLSENIQLGEPVGIGVQAHDVLPR